ncbi:hypothetical protein SDC9_66769 [bioreactor metagenome]|uniref:Flagellar assembly protein FliH/Type III secretion system HrpE domain-containing protein n=1 Tax=bioreactor metagenome TaxID=1076179 RepID=A0A644XVV6_9ZZZZ
MLKIIKFASVQDKPLIINNHRPDLEIVQERTDIAPKPEQNKEVIEQVNRIISDAHEQAEACVKQALLEAEKLKQQAYEAGRQEGYQAGYNEGVLKGKEQAVIEMTNEVSRAVEKAQNILDSAQQAYKETIIEAEREIIKIALAVTRKILAREMDENPTVVLPIVKAALEKVRDQEHIVIRVSPEDYDLVIQAKRDLQIMIGRESALSVVNDHTVSQSSCMIDTSYGTVDASIDTQFEAVKKAIEEIMP